MANEKEIFKELCNAINNYDEQSAKKVARTAVEAKVDLIKGIEVMSSTIKEIGEKFHRGDIFLPHLVMASDAMIAAIKIFEPNISKEDLKKTKFGIIVLGTVEGDLHDIGLNLVAMSLFTAGFEVFNLGKDVRTERFIEKAIEFNANIIGASTLLSVTMHKQRDLVDEVKYRKLPFKVMIGGGPVTRRWAEEIGADGYGADATEAVECAKELIKRKEKN